MTCAAPIPSVNLPVPGGGRFTTASTAPSAPELWRSDSKDKMPSFVRAPWAGLSRQCLRAPPPPLPPERDPPGSTAAPHRLCLV